ncbi:MAG TPA: TerB family tellurite resistance protein [Aquaticitalea sp.]|nr:TerB family tellurite resistance protein [Aquaticitalea sp.]
MSFSKWIGASLGWAFGGPIGAIIGLALGSMVEGFSKSDFGKKLGEGHTAKSQRRQHQTYERPQRQTPTTKSGDFEVSLLVLASVVIKADGTQDQRELDFVRQQFVAMYGKDRANSAFRLFKDINQQQVPLRQVCQQIQRMMDHPSRLQLLHFLFGIAKADGIVTEAEVGQIYTISGYLGISSRDYESIKAMFYDSADNAYKILEIDKGATVNEIKAAYRKMAKKYHPDRVVHLGEEHQKGAAEKFRQVQQAYEKLQKELKF